MNIEIRHNCAQFHKMAEHIAQRIPQAQKKALSVAGESMFVTSKRLLTQLVYQKAIPKWRNGKPKWRRKMRNGGILGAETYAINKNGFEFVILTEPSSEPAKAIKNWPGGYMQKRHESEKRRAPWRTLAKEQGTPRAEKKFRDSFAEDMASATPWRR